MAFYRLQEKLIKKYGKRLINTVNKTGIDAAKTTSKNVLQNSSEVTDNLIGDEISEKVTSVGKGTAKDEIPSQEINIPTENCHQIINDLKLI